MRERLLRGIAILIALAAVADPAVVLERRIRPLVSVVASEQDSALAQRVARELGGSFTVVRAPLSAADAMVIVGRSIPKMLPPGAAVLFGVLPLSGLADVRITQFSAPRQLPAAATSTIHATATIRNARGRQLEVELRANGILADRVSYEIRSDSETIVVAPTFVPSALGAASLEVTASIAGAGASTTAQGVVDVHVDRSSVLFYDTRPSWMSTFVRRAVEADPRFEVASRVVTSRNVASDAGSPPSALDNLTALVDFDVIVAGAPDALTARDLAGLQSFTRRRGGSVLLLFDQQPGRTFGNLLGVSTWLVSYADAVQSLSSGADAAGLDAGLQAAEIMWPATLPPAARGVLTAESVEPGGIGRPVVWESAMGTGRVVVSGALDAWRYRSSEDASFDQFWRNEIARLAALAAPPLSVSVHPTVARPGEEVSLLVSLRDAMVDSATARERTTVVRASLQGGSGAQALRLLPEGVRSMRAAFRAPAAEGLYRAFAEQGGSSDAASLLVSGSMSRAIPDESAAIGALASSRGGTTVAEPELSRLVPAMRLLLKAEEQPVQVRIMRSVWWILPFSLALCGEWWLRRRRGLV
jgi:hypothetical protein